MDQLMELHMDEMNETMKFCNKREFNEMNEIHNHFEWIKLTITYNTIMTPTHLGYQFQSFNKNV
jgi:hypothetical protein